MVIAYTTMWGSTDELAKAIADGTASAGVQTQVYDLAVTPFARIMREVLDSKGLLIGSSTLHRGMLYRASGFLQYLEGLKPTGRVGAAFGSYGWSSGACKQIVGRLEEMGVTVLQEPYTQKYRPTADELKAAREWGMAFAESLKAANREEATAS